jgi:hypothetical protein
MNEMMAYCGTICGECPAYIATQANDQTALEQVAAQWREEYFSPEITVADVRCDGCTSDQGAHCNYCGQCPIRACARKKGVVSCVQCDDYGCATIQEYFSVAPEMQAMLDEMREEWLADQANV